MDNKKIYLSIDSILDIQPEDTLMFDMDGTLIESDSCNTKAYKKAVANVLGEFFVERLDVVRIDRKVLREKLPWISGEQFEHIVTLKEQYYMELITEVTIVPAIMAILERFLKTNKIILITNAHCQRTMQTLCHLDLTDKFDGIITNDISNGKDKFTRALKYFNLNPQKVWVFENDEVQANIAVAAGIDINHIILK